MPVIAGSGLGQVKAKSQQLHLGFCVDGRGPGTWVILAGFPDLLVGSWIGSRAEFWIGTKTESHVCSTSFEGSSLTCYGTVSVLGFFF